MDVSNLIFVFPSADRIIRRMNPVLVPQQHQNKSDSLI